MRRVVGADGGVVRCDDETDVGDAAIGKRREDVVEERSTGVIGDHPLEAGRRGSGLPGIERHPLGGAAHAAAESARENDGGGRGRDGHDSTGLALHIFGTIRSSTPALITKTVIQKAAVRVWP